MSDERTRENPLYSAVVRQSLSHQLNDERSQNDLTCSKPRSPFHIMPLSDHRDTLAGEGRR